MNFAIGVAGINPFRDYRGKKDLFGQVLKVKNVAVVDEIAAAAELLMGQAREGKPVVVLRGLRGVVEVCEEVQCRGSANFKGGRPFYRSFVIATLARSRWLATPSA